MPAPPPPSKPSNAPFRVGGNIREPRRVFSVAPVYPAIARQARVQGTVVIQAVIGADGAVRDAQVQNSMPLLDQAALDAVRQWRYEPTQLNGVPVAVIMTVSVRFTLQ
jgi:protein TonB